MKGRKVVWIVEANYEQHHANMTGWHPTVGVGLTKADALLVLKDWKKRNPDDWFRVSHYVRAKP